MKKQLLFLFAALLPMLAGAQTKVEIDGIWYNLITKAKVAEVTFKGDYYDSYSNEYSGSITIPATVTYEGVDHSVTSIGDEAFRGCSSLTAITIPESVTSIGNGAFSGCRLTAITIPESVTSIGNDAFYDCIRLYKVINFSDLDIQKGSTDNGYVAYYAQVVYQGGELTTIGDFQFYTSDGIHSLVNYIGKDTGIVLPDSYNGESYNIGEWAFSGCSSLKSITIPEGVTSIGEYAFSDCSSLESFTIPEGVTSIGGGAFSGCSSLTAITIPEGVTSIGGSAFQFCSSLTAITIPEGVTSIGERAFYECGSLTAITIPEGVTSIGNDAFCECYSLTAITIPESVTSIGEGAFVACSSLTTITIPKSVTSIGDGAFYSCRSLTAITIPENSQLTSIGDEAFCECYSLTAITIPEGVTSIGHEAFLGCSSLTAITLPKGLTSIEEGTFVYCSSLTTITIPEGVTSIGRSAFFDCSSLTAIVLPKSVEYIRSDAFAGCSELSDVYCYAETVPGTETDPFMCYIEHATLHVPASAVNSYKSALPWSRFGKIIALGAYITEITLSESSATLTEGEEMTLTATVEPDDAADTSVTWSSSNPSVATVDNTGKVTAVAPGTATITATANDGSGVSAACEVTVKEKLLGKCATPVISYKDGEVVFACETEEVTFISETTEDIAGNRNNAKFAIVPTYTITAYATKEKYEDSDVATLTLCWIPCTEEHEDEEETGIFTIPAKPVLISTQGGTITVSGLAAGTEVTVYSTAGALLATAESADGTATLNTDLTAGNIAVVKIGEHSIKVAIK